MKRISYILVILIIATAFGTVKSAQSKDPNDFGPFKGPKPVVVLMQTNPWLMVIGSDTPMTAIYEDGQVIYLNRERNKKTAYLHKVLGHADFEKIKQKIISFGDFVDVKKDYTLSDATDQPETLIYMNFDKINVVTRVYGLNVDSRRPLAKNTVSLPQSVRKLHEYLTHLEFTATQKWEPNYTEVMVWPYEYAEGEPLHWPKDWPNLDSPNTLKRNDSYSIFVPGTNAEKLRNFLEELKEKQAVEIGGKKWSVGFRPVFPSEPVWRKAFEAK
ncbi:MAG: hypothetical protein Q7T18_12105 [Sedimentisphaerales bacterium]|nr:hypothetical protein [Sedimentisphaerales bacterium]